MEAPKCRKRMYYTSTSSTTDHATNSYPKHVWSPAGGWYTQPANWKANTMIMGGVIFGITAMAWSVSADREHRDKMPEVRLPTFKWERQQKLTLIRSLTDSSLRDGGAEKLSSTRRHRRQQSSNDCVKGWVLSEFTEGRARCLFVYAIQYWIYATSDSRSPACRANMPSLY